MARFEEIFAQWADRYDQTVLGDPGEYDEVFADYVEILGSIARSLQEAGQGVVLDIGTGTGNLAGLLLESGFEVQAVEPSPEMRAIAQRKHPELVIHDGDFLNLPEEVPGDLQGIVSSYAFHHLTDQEKRLAVRSFNARLPVGGQVIFADTAYENLQFKDELLKETQERGYLNLLADLEREYYTTLGVLEDIFTVEGFKVEFTRMNKFVWLIVAQKIREVE